MNMESKEYKGNLGSHDIKDVEFCVVSVSARAKACAEPLQTPRDIAERYTLKEFLGSCTKSSSPTIKI